MAGARTMATFFNMRETVVDEIADEVIDDAVEGLTSFLARRDQTQQAKDRQLMAQRGH